MPGSSCGSSIHQLKGNRASVPSILFLWVAQAFRPVRTPWKGCATKGGTHKFNIDGTLAQVENILGKGTEQAGVGGALGTLAGSARTVSWTEGEKSPRRITITFVNGKVIAKIETGL
jgi:hypothetical protein